MHTRAQRAVELVKIGVLNMNFQSTRVTVKNVRGVMIDGGPIA